jgi:peptidoglycan/xylan/chitin deacetylase (PgdA/CDA1 family)
VITRRQFAIGALSIGPGLSQAAPIAARAAPPFAWPGGARAAVSLTYDDGLDSQIDNVAPALEAVGLKGTFFLTRDNMEERAADWQAVHRKGHEMGNHSVTHPCDLKLCEAASFRAQEIAPMEAYLDETFGPGRFRSYAYPCGYVALGAGDEASGVARYRQALDGLVAAARTVKGPPNAPADVVANPFMLTAYEPTYFVDDPRQAFVYVKAAMRRGGWAILVFHDVLVKRQGEGDTSVASHKAVLQWLREQPVWCAPLGEVFLHCAGPAA